MRLNRNERNLRRLWQRTSKEIYKKVERML